MRTAICPGSFDPVTLGHMDILVRASKIFDKVVVVLPSNPEKNYSFTVDERIELLKKASEEVGINVSFDVVHGLLADYAKTIESSVIVKGLRALSDFEYEFQMALTNNKLNEELDTIFLSTKAEYMFLSSSMVKQVASFGGDISHFVPKCILETIKKRLCAGGN